MFFSGTLWSVAPWWLGALAFVVIAIGRLVGRRTTRATCPRCRYDMSGTVDRSRCPECGLAIESDRALFRRRRRPWLGVVALAAAMTLVAVPYREPLRVWAIQTVLPRYVVLASGRAGPARVTIEHDRWNDLGIGFYGPDRAAIQLPNGSRSVIIGDAYFSFGALGSRNSRPGGLPPDDSVGFGKPFANISGREGASELVVTHESGGSGGYARTEFYAIEPSGVRLLAEIQNAWLDDRDGDGVFTVLGFDAVFHYRWTSGAGSPRPAIHLRRVDASRFELDPDLMRRDAPDDSSIAALVARIESAPAGEREAWLSPLLHGTIGLLYGGRPQTARRFLSAHWRGSPEELARFETEFRETFSTSAYAHQIRSLSTESPAWP